MGKAAKMKRAGIFDPYLDTLGGGERYTMTVAYCLAEKDWQVDVFWDDRGIGRKLEKRLGIDLKKINFVPNLFKENFFKKMSLMKKYDLLFYLSDGSVPSLFAKRNLLHFQVPFHHVGGRKPLNQVKLKRIDYVICNSQLTKRFIDKEYGVQSRVVYPPVAVKEFKPGKKKNIIFSVGRFSRLMQAKRQDVLVDVFGQIAKELGDWQLVLAGGTDIGKDKTFDLLKQKAKRLPVEIIDSPSFSELKNLYAQAKIFWTAAGFGVDEEQNPEKVEQFGITTVEAMAAGCVPIVINKGGQPEIVNHQQDGLLWKSKEELIKQTLKVARDNQLREKLARAAQKRAQVFSQEQFCQEIVKLAQ